MTKSTNNLWIIFATLIIARIIAMIFFPLQDTTEARYGEIARIMAETGDWITPYFDYNVPFWGKPPLVFWLEALSIKLFGLNDFTPRLPSLIASLGTAALLYKLLITLRNRETALWGIVIYMSIGLVFILSGVVILDPIFTFTTTLAYVSFVMVLQDKGRYWSHLFFVGIALGLLSKGPLILVLVGGTIGLWLLFSLRRWRVFMLYPWISGISLMLIIALPWYFFAEAKTPGFIDYFIVGEHFKRFTDPGWSGDLYGVAHQTPLGYIWLEWLVVSLPWGIIAIALFLKNAWSNNVVSIINSGLKNETFSFYLLWALFPMLFFTISGNVLSTYVLPGLPALAIILALHLDKHPFFSNSKKRIYFLNSILILPIILTILVIYTDQNRNIVRTEKYLMQTHQAIAQKDEPLYYLRKKPFSARFYSNGKIKLLTYKEFKNMQNNNPEKSYYLAVQENHLHRVEKIYGHPLQKLYSSRLYDLVKIDNND